MEERDMKTWEKKYKNKKLRLRNGIELEFGLSFNSYEIGIDAYIMPTIQLLCNLTDKHIIGHTGEPPDTSNRVSGSVCVISSFASL